MQPGSLYYCNYEQIGLRWSRSYMRMATPIHVAHGQKTLASLYVTGFRKTLRMGFL